MTVTTHDGPAIAAATPIRRHLYGPVLDFLLLGGASILLLPLAFLLPAEKLTPGALTIGLGLSFVINYPHFAHSYQIFYRDFWSKAVTGAHAPTLRGRYIFAGIVAPIVLAAYLLWALVYGSPRLLGYSANAMFFLVGWHYVKQGYGMVMVDAALKKTFLRDPEKKALLVNSYVGWVFTWVLANRVLSRQELFGIQYVTFAFPTWLLGLLGAALLATSCAVGVAFYRTWQVHRALPWSGIAAYFASLYVWLGLTSFNPLVRAFAPAFHSLQYLAVVWRYQLSAERAKGHGRGFSTTGIGGVLGSAGAGLVLFMILGAIIGAAMFWGAPLLLTTRFNYSATPFGAAVLLFLFWVFINVHHYLLDNVMWRRENPDTRKYLFD